MGITKEDILKTVQAVPVVTMKMIIHMFGCFNSNLGKIWTSATNMLFWVKFGFKQPSIFLSVFLSIYHMDIPYTMWIYRQYHIMHTTNSLWFIGQLIFFFCDDSEALMCVSHIWHSFLWSSILECVFLCIWSESRDWWQMKLFWFPPQCSYWSCSPISLPQLSCHISTVLSEKHEKEH